MRKGDNGQIPGQTDNKDTRWNMNQRHIQNSVKHLRESVLQK